MINLLITLTQQGLEGELVLKTEHQFPTIEQAEAKIQNLKEELHLEPCPDHVGEWLAVSAPLNFIDEKPLAIRVVERAQAWGINEQHLPEDQVDPIELAMYEAHRNRVLHPAKYTFRIE